LSRYSDYFVKSSKMLPILYWDVNSGSTEISQVEYPALISKSNNVIGNRSLIFGNQDGSSILSNSNSSISIPLSSSYPVARAGKELRPWTINLVYQHLSDEFSPDTPIFSIGSDVNLYFSGQKFYLNIRGKKLYVSINSYKELFYISIVNNKNGGNLIVNDYQTEALGAPTTNFSDNTAISIASNNSSKFQVSAVSIYPKELPLSEIQTLREYNFYPNSYEDAISKYSSLTVGNSFFNSSTIAKYSTSIDNIIFRNSNYINGEFYLNSKNLAKVSSCSFSGSSVSFSSGGYISVYSPEIDYLDTVINFEGSFSTASGTIFYMESQDIIEGRLNGSGTLSLLINGSQVYSSSVSGTSISIGFYNNEVFVDSGSGYVSSTFSMSGSASPDYLYIGNSATFDNTYSSTLTEFSINYYNNPLSIGKYKLDFTYSYGSVGYIKPQQSGLALWSVAISEPFESTSVDFISYSSKIKTVLAQDLLSEEDWYSGDEGDELKEGTSAKSLGSPISPNMDESPVILYVAVILEDTENEIGIAHV